MEYLVAGSILWFVICISLASQSLGSRMSVAATSPLQHGVYKDRRSDRRFSQKLFIGALLARLSIVFVFTATDAIRTLHLSPDSLRYHREGVVIASQMAAGNFNWPNWIDNAWFQFTGFIYYLLAPEPFLIQLINITLGALTPILVYHLVARAYENQQCARWAAILTAFFPSFIYWSCLMLKDSLSIFAMALLVLSLVSIRQKFNVKWLLSIGFTLLVFIGIREYMFFVTIFFILVSFFPVEGKRTGPLIIKLTLLVVLLGAGTYVAGFGILGLDYIKSSHYFDLEYINQSRVNIGDHGSGAFFDDPSQALWGKDITSTLKAAGAAIYFFLVSVDLTRLGSIRQLMALPEVLLTICLIPSLFRGVVYSWRNFRQQSLPLMIFAFGIMAVYSSAATNMGAMFRWRMQAMPFILAFIVLGLVAKGRGKIYQSFKRVLG